MESTPQERLRTWRKGEGLTQKDAGDRFDVSQAFWSELETGESSPNRDLAVLIENTVGIRLEEWSDDPRVPEAMEANVRRRRRNGKAA